MSVVVVDRVGFVVVGQVEGWRVSRGRRRVKVVVAPIFGVRGPITILGGRPGLDVEGLMWKRRPSGVPWGKVCIKGM